MRLYPRLKRGFDVVVAAVLLVVTSPVQAVVALLVRRDLGSPVLFRQVRPGLHGEPFTLVKFRTMRTVAGMSGSETDSLRLTPLGGRLRSTSLDELPTLWNVLRGDMSLVGPRPLLMEYLERYSPEEFRRHDVRPGITGLAQVTGRNALSWQEKFAADVQYVDSMSPRMDARILLATLVAVVSRTGISAPGEATMPAYLGHQQRDAG